MRNNQTLALYLTAQEKYYIRKQKQGLDNLLHDWITHSVLSLTQNLQINAVAKLYQEIRKLFMVRARARE